MADLDKGGYPGVLLTAYVVYRYYPKGNQKIRQRFIILSGIGLIIMAGRTAYFNVTEDNQMKQVRYIDLISPEKQKELLGEEGQFMAGSAKGGSSTTKECFPMSVFTGIKIREPNVSFFSRDLPMSNC